MTKSRKVFKYGLMPAPGHVQETPMPRGAHIIHAVEQRNVICLWAEVDENEEMETRLFQVLGTNHEIDSSATHLGTVQMPPFVWHVYEHVQQQKDPGLLDSMLGDVTPENLHGENPEY